MHRPSLGQLMFGWCALITISAHAASPVDLSALLARERAKHRLPAASLTDRWHLGSNTKAMTATLVAALVERDVLTWRTTIA
ncbi:MAG: serine hydrolase [Chromatiales bacterium]|nr:serine hydrolase [Chromatiales bacterium]